MKKEKFYPEGNRRFSFRAFTVIELLVVISIIGLLSSIILVATKGVREKARIAAGLQFSASVHHAIGADIIGEWKFEDNVNDTSGNENHGDNHGVSFVPNDASPQLGKAGEFNSAYLNYVEIPEIPDSTKLDGMENLTIALWLKLKNPAESYEIIHKEDCYELEYQFILAGSRIRLSVHPREQATLFEYFWDFPQDKKWHHIVATFKGVGSPGGGMMYLDGLEIQKHSIDWINFPVNNNDNPLFIGRGSNIAVDYYLDGFVDEVRIYSEALRIAQIRKLYVEGAIKRGLLTKE